MILRCKLIPRIQGSNTGFKSNSNAMLVHEVLEHINHMLTMTDHRSSSETQPSSA